MTNKEILNDILSVEKEYLNSFSMVLNKDITENIKNQIHTYDIVDHLLGNKKYVERDNIKFFMKDIIESPEVLNDTRFIMLDTFHEGVYEISFYEKLKEINYKGILFCDDIHLNEKMENFWNLITHEKYDITDKGHETGSGIVLFE